MGAFTGFFKGYKEGQKYFGETISVIINSAFLTIVYFLGIGMTFIFAKFFKKNFMELIPREVLTYWSVLNLTKKEKGEYTRQF